MSENTRYSQLLVHVMSPELRDEFFGDDEVDTDNGWDLFETLHPEKAEILVGILKPMLDEVMKDLKFKRDYNILLGKGDELGAARLRVCYQASKLNW